MEVLTNIVVVEGDLFATCTNILMFVVALNFCGVICSVFSRYFK